MVRKKNAFSLQLARRRRNHEIFARLIDRRTAWNSLVCVDRDFRAAFASGQRYVEEMSVQGINIKNGNHNCDYSRIVPEKLTRWEAIRTSIYDPKRRTVFGRTRRSWGVVGLFYLVFFSVLTVFCAICYHGFMLTIKLDRPTYILESSIIGTSPGLGFRPISERIEEGSLIWYNASNTTEVAKWTRRIDKFLEPYNNGTVSTTKLRNRQVCSETQRPSNGKVCIVEKKDWGPHCSRKADYGYKNSAPCVFIKLNKIYGWTPTYYNDSEDLHPEMPTQLRDVIAASNTTTRNAVWVSCDGQNPADRENIGDLEYFPKFQGFPGYYFPYLNTPGYLSPLVAVRFLRPTNHVIINVECRAWAKNIRYSGSLSRREGSVHFQIMVDG